MIFVFRIDEFNVKNMYVQLIEKIERMSRLVDFFTVKFTSPGIVIPAFFVTLINFFVYDYGDDSYFLPFRVMYV